MRLYCTSLTAGPVVQMPSVSMLTQLVVHFPIHQPFFLPQLPLAQASLSLSGVLKFLPLETHLGACGVPAAAAISPSVVVAVRSTELPPVRDPERRLRSHHGIAGVSAVPGHRQLVLTDLITNGERRVFGRVPQTRSTLDLLADTRHQ